MNKPVVLSEQTLVLAERRAREQGFETVEAYLGDLVERDLGNGDLPDWMWEKVEEGIASGNAGEMTREKLHRLCEEGIVLASRKK